MKRKLIFIISIILILVISFIILIDIKNSKSKMIEIMVTAHGGIPYQWEYEVSDEQVVRYIKNYVLDEDSSIAGGTIHMKFVFKGVKKGKTTIRLNYRNIIDGSIKRKEVYHVTVDQDLNISLDKK